MIVVFSSSLVVADQHVLEMAINGEHRKESSVRDKYRNPKETLTFLGVEADHKVLEISPGGGGWYTEILGPYLNANGQLVLGHFDKNSDVPYFKRNYQKLVDKLETAPELYGNVKLGVFQAPGVYDIPEMGTYDRVLTFRNVHNWTRNGDEEMNKIFKLFFDALKPGGKLGVIEHRLPEDRDSNGAGGYVKQSYVIQLAEAAGFKFEASSEVNANPKDTADYEKGVWTLPPSYRMGDEDREKYEAIGESDRMTLLFVKP
jgi:predicted methyltransferase